MNEAEEEREMLKNMNDEERRQWERENPKQVGVSSRAFWWLQAADCCCSLLQHLIQEQAAAAGSL